MYVSKSSQCRIRISDEDRCQVTMYSISGDTVLAESHYIYHDYWTWAKWANAEDYLYSVDTI